MFQEGQIGSRVTGRTTRSRLRYASVISSEGAAVKVNWSLLFSTCMNLHNTQSGFNNQPDDLEEHDAQYVVGCSVIEQVVRTSCPFLKSLQTRLRQRLGNVCGNSGVFMADNRSPRFRNIVSACFEAQNYHVLHLFLCSNIVLVLLPGPCMISTI